MIDLSPVITALTVAAGLSLGVERTLEYLKHVIDQGIGTLIPNKKLRRLQQVDQTINDAEKAVKQAKEETKLSESENNEDSTETTESGATNDEAGELFDEAEIIEKYPAPDIPIIPLTPLSQLETAKALFLQVSGVGLGIIFVQLFDLRLLSIFMDASGYQQLPPYFSIVDILFTGLVVGGGSQPIHVLIRFLTERKITTGEGEIKKDVEKAKSIGKVVSSAQLVEDKKEDVHVWKDITYAGGVDPRSLEDVHKRPANPNLIVYHHTAMSSVSSFQKIKDEFLLRKKWRTGYHCVIMPEGTIQPFCRWDRFGNHAKGLNKLSLGIAFHGNFHTEPNDAFSNADGRYGNQAPTETQLHAGARVVALWINLYEDIHLDFKNSILPHRKAIPGHTVCPGSNFPHKKFEHLVRHYYDSWVESEHAKDMIDNFKTKIENKKYIYV